MPRIPRTANSHFKNARHFCHVKPISHRPYAALPATVVRLVLSLSTSFEIVERGERESSNERRQERESPTSLFKDWNRSNMFLLQNRIQTLLNKIESRKKLIKERRKEKPQKGEHTKLGKRDYQEQRRLERDDGSRTAEMRDNGNEKSVITGRIPNDSSERGKYGSGDMRNQKSLQRNMIEKAFVRTQRDLYLQKERREGGEKREFVFQQQFRRGSERKRIGRVHDIRKQHGVGYGRRL